MGRKTKDPRDEPVYEWDKLPDESPQQYERFCFYRDFVYYSDTELQSANTVDITKRRSYRATADHFGLSINSVEAAGKRYRWQKRCEAYDRHIALLARQENEKKVKKMLNNHALLGAAMVQRAAARFISLKEGDISASDTIRMADIGVKIERMSRGISAEDTVVVVQPEDAAKEKPAATVDVPPVYDLASLSDEELQQLESIIGKIGTPAGG